MPSANSAIGSNLSNPTEYHGDTSAFDNQRLWRHKKDKFLGVFEMNISDYGYASQEQLLREMSEFAAGVASTIVGQKRRNAICIAFDVGMKTFTYGYAGQLSQSFNQNLLLNFADFVQMSESDVSRVRLRSQRPYCQCAEAHAVAKMTQEIRRQSISTGRRNGNWVNEVQTGLYPGRSRNAAGQEMNEWLSHEEGGIWNAWEVLKRTVLMPIREPRKVAAAPYSERINPCGNCLEWIRAGNVGGYFNIAGQLIQPLTP